MFPQLTPNVSVCGPMDGDPVWRETYVVPLGVPAEVESLTVPKAGDGR